MKKKKRKFNKKWVIVSGIIILMAIALIIILKFGKPGAGGNGGGGEQIEIVPLSQEQINILGQNVLSSEFIGDLPSKGIIGLRFYDFRDGERIWQSGFLIGKEGFLSSGTPDMILVMNAKYISELNQKDLCEVVQTAKANNDMWVESELSNAKLLLKYSSMIKHRDCFGF